MLRDTVKNRSRIILVGAGAVLVAAAARGQVETRPIDTSNSSLTVLVYKSGLFSAFADDHVIRAPLAGGSVSEASSPRVELAVRAADLKVLDPGLSAERRGEVQTRQQAH